MNNLLNKRIPNLMESGRNYDRLIIGDESYLKYLKIEDNTLILTNYNRNFYTDFLVLKRYYSFLHKNGECIFVFDFNRYKYFKKQKINTIDYQFLHIVTLYENKINVESLNYKIQKYLNIIKMIWYKSGLYLKNIKKINIEDIKEQLIELNEFAKERDIFITIIVKNFNKTINNKFSNIKFKEV